jgi:hypothetical protein
MYRKTMLELPEEVSDNLIVLDATNRDLLLDYIVALRLRGWTLESISVPLGRTRERIRQMEMKAVDRNSIAIVENAGLELPHPPLLAVREVKERIQPDADTIARLKELQPLAQSVRSSSPKYRAEAEEYTRLINDENVRGVSLYRLAKELNVTHAALRFRLVRYGYKSSSSEAKVYQPIFDKHRTR